MDAPIDDDPPIRALPTLREIRSEFVTDKTPSYIIAVAGRERGTGRAAY